MTTLLKTRYLRRLAEGKMNLPIRSPRLPKKKGIMSTKKLKYTRKHYAPLLKNGARRGMIFRWSFSGHTLDNVLLSKGVNEMAKEVAKKEGGAVQAFDPSMFEEDAGRGMENMGQEDLALPFLKILSGLDPLLDTHETARKGDIYNTVSGDVSIGKTGIRVIPCAYQRRFIQWAPRGVGSGAPIAIFEPTDSIPKTERSSEDNKEYVVDGDGSYIEETHQHFVVVLKEDGSSETALIAMKSTQLKKSRKWNSMIQSTTMVGKNGPFQAPRFSHVYLLKTIAEENSKGSWHGWEMSKEGPIESAALYAQAKGFAESILSGDVVVKHSEDEVSSSKDIPF